GLGEECSGGAKQSSSGQCVPDRAEGLGPQGSRPGRGGPPWGYSPGGRWETPVRHPEDNRWRGENLNATAGMLLPIKVHGSGPFSAVAREKGIFRNSTSAIPSELASDDRGDAPGRSR